MSADQSNARPGQGPASSTSGAALPGARLQRCPVHDGQVHGKEAEQLRSGLEKLLEEGSVSEATVRRLLDRVDAADSLAHLEMVPTLDSVMSEMMRLARLAGFAAHVKLSRPRKKTFAQLARKPRAQKAVAK